MAGKADSVLAPPTLSEKWALKPRLPAKVKAVLGFGDARIIRKEKLDFEPMLLPAKVKTAQTCLSESHSGAV